MNENYISLDRAIERMYAVTEEFGTERIHIDRIIDELENLPSCPNICIHPRWIPVSERLPEKDLEDVLAFDGISGFFITFMKTTIHGKRYFVIGHDDVTHWMPLPEPPKEKENV